MSGGRRGSGSEAVPVARNRSKVPHRLVAQLAELRTVQGFSARTASLRAGLSDTAVWNWDTGEHQPRVVALESYGALLGVRLAWVSASADVEQAELLRRLELERRRPVPPPALEPLSHDDAAANRALLAAALGCADDYTAGDAA